MFWKFSSLKLKTELQELKDKFKDLSHAQELKDKIKDHAHAMEVRDLGDEIMELKRQLKVILTNQRNVVHSNKNKVLLKTVLRRAWLKVA